jgi:peptidoglycan hydrolase-like protein with peptidoglycan-binding domain
VRQLQIYLNTHGFPIATAGNGSLGNETTYFGVATQRALIAFQKSKGITPANGYFGPKTRAVLLSGSASASGATTVAATTTTVSGSSISSAPFTNDFSYGMSDPEISILQRFLAEDPGLYPQGVVTGYYGLATQQAVQSFQLTYGLQLPAADYGSFDAVTRGKMNALYVAGKTP